MTPILSHVASSIVFIISHLSYLGVVFLMAIESANIPLPSELIMPTAGYLVSQGTMNIHVAAISGAIGCLLGSLVSYALGAYGGRPFLEKYGKFFLLTRHDLDLGDRWFSKYGDSIAFFSRLVPIIRTFISFPAGVARMNLLKFSAYSFIGSWIWSYVLLIVGIKIGQNKELIAAYFHKFDVLVGIIILAGVAYYLYSHIKKLRSLHEADNSQNS